MLGLTLPNNLKKYRAYLTILYMIFKVQRMLGLTLPNNLKNIGPTLPSYICIAYEY